MSVLMKHGGHGLSTPLTADPTVFSLYLVHLIQQDRSVSCINSAIYGAIVAGSTRRAAISSSVTILLCSRWRRPQEGSLIGPQVAGGLWKPAMLRALSIASSEALCLISRWLLCSLWVSLASFVGWSESIDCGQSSVWGFSSCRISHTEEEWSVSPRLLGFHSLQRFITLLGCSGWEVSEGRQLWQEVAAIQAGVVHEEGNEA